MRKVVSNTTPLISLIKIGQLQLLEFLYTQVIIPGAVWQEVQVGIDNEIKPLLEALMSNGVWISKQLKEDVLVLANEAS